MKISPRKFFSLLPFLLSVFLPSDVHAGQAEGRAQIWAQTCARCHHQRNPESYNDAQWDVAVHHMKVRAYLSEEDARAIREFLKAAN